MTRAATFFPAKLTVPASIDFHIDVNLTAPESTVAETATVSTVRTDRIMINSMRFSC